MERTVREKTAPKPLLAGERDYMMSMHPTLTARNLEVYVSHESKKNVSGLSGSC